MSNRLGELYSHEAIRDFGAALRRSLRTEDVKDFASLTEIDRANDEEAFADAMKTFLRRYETPASRKHWTRPGEDNLEKLMELTEEHDLSLIKAALISHALTKRKNRENVEVSENV